MSFGNDLSWESLLSHTEPTFPLETHDIPPDDPRRMFYIQPVPNDLRPATSNSMSVVRSSVIENQIAQAQTAKLKKYGLIGAGVLAFLFIMRK